jgi:hypothetical protein
MEDYVLMKDEQGKDAFIDDKAWEEEFQLD